MPAVIAIKKTQSSAVPLVSGGLILGGLALVLVSMGRKEPINPVPEGKLEPPTSISLVGSSAITVPMGSRIDILDPIARYRGPGRDAYAHFQVKQKQYGALVTVQASGVAGSHLGPAQVLTPYHLVAPDQVQPEGDVAQALRAYPWGTGEPIFPPSYGICGAPPVPGYADAYLEIYERKAPNDFDGYASPSCNGRIPVARLMLANKILYVS